MSYIHVERCWTGRRWVQVGELAVGFGPRHFIERIYWRGRLRYVWHPRHGLTSVPGA